MLENRVLQSEGSSFLCNVKGQATGPTPKSQPCFVTHTASKAVMHIRDRGEHPSAVCVVARRKLLGSIVKKWVKVNTL